MIRTNNLTKYLFKGLLIGAVATSILSGCKEQTPKQPHIDHATATEAHQAAPAKNVILLIGDGMGFNHLKAGTIYRLGNEQGLPYKSFPVQLAMSTFTRDGGYSSATNWSNFDSPRHGATDSAAAGTALASGEKTYRYGLGVNRQRHPITNIVELAEQAGKSTGVVSSVPFSHATPASFVSHNVTRKNYEEIAREMILQSDVDVIMGCGHPWYDGNGHHVDKPESYQFVGGLKLWTQLEEGTAGGDADGDNQDDPWSLIQSRLAFQQLTQGSTPKRVIGVAQVAKTLQQRRGETNSDEYSSDTNTNRQPYSTPLNDNVPTLVEMAQGAINVLDNNPAGFFLMIEGGAIDWASHANQSDRLIEEQVDFDHTVSAVIDWVENNSSWDETLVIVTADHECGYLTGPGSDPQWNDLINNGKGVLPGVEWHKDGHTNSLVPIFARGPQAQQLIEKVKGTDRIYGDYIDNTDLFPTMLTVVKGQ